ncbi:uncharacterized protein LOC143216716 [Lasioglossum baleicum]|uniref:uncharacterized protein LOC143216716 n=1 Tax=Lasioglossum baleicum TaxID=434251 RepID=UPI003FCCD21F
MVTARQLIILSTSGTSTATPTTTKPDDSSQDPSSAPIKPPADPNGYGNSLFGNSRARRAIVERFSSKQVYADGQHKTVCVKIITNSTVTRDCALTTACTGDNCYACDTDGCNSATSVAVYTSMMFGLLAFVFMTR